MNTLRKSGWPAGILAALVVLVVLVVLARFLVGVGAPLHLAEDRVGSPQRSGDAQARASAADPSRPNIVFILTDDLSMDLLPYMPHVLAMEQQGLSFSELLRLGFAVLPLARLDLHRQLPARHGRVQQHGHRRWL